MNIFFCEDRRPSPSVFRLLQALRCFSSSRITNPTSSKRIDKALRILNPLPSPKPNVSAAKERHLRLIEDFFKTVSNVFDELPHDEAHDETNSTPPDPTQDEETEGVGAIALSRAVSLCASTRDLRSGVQYHCAALSTGFISNVYVGSSLITMYSKCGEVYNASKMFDEMALRNVVSWTAIIAGYAQGWQVDVCFKLYRSMRISSSEANDLTLVSLFRACTGSGALRQGRTTHSQTIRMGFSLYIHVGNSLISMYSKCGALEEALRMFNEMPRRDIVSWNSMIAGYAHYGLALEAIEILKEMEREKVTPDSITFLGILSSCRHAGLLDQGRFYFDSMARHGLEPELDHYSCVVDLLGRTGKLQEAREFVEGMPIPANAVIWGSLLSSCRVHSSFWIGIEAAKNRLVSEPECATTHVQLANLYASVGLWGEAARMRKLMKDQGLKTLPGCSWIEIGSEVHKFRAEDVSNPNAGMVHGVLGTLMDHMRSYGYLHEVSEEEDGIHTDSNLVSRMGLLF